MDKSEWSAPMWQAHIEKLPTREERKAALEDVPAEWRTRVKRHLQTVWAIRQYRKRKHGK